LKNHSETKKPSRNGKTGYGSCCKPVENSGITGEFMRISNWTARFRSLVLVAAAFLCLASSCIKSFSPTNPPEYYQLDYTLTPSECVKPFSGAVRMWPFSASAPFDHEQMVIVTPSQTVRFSSTYKWIGPPGNMLADKLMRDLSAAHMFENAIPVGSPMFAAYEMGGHIYRFALEENGSPPHAILDLEVSLWQEKPTRIVLFRKHFHYQSAPLGNSDPAEFAGAMAGLISKLSLDLRKDLCTITEDNSHPAGG
jgi:ABC-type uncharacterized transport system auxiliary subunit